MNDAPDKKRRVAVVGGGISGLVAAKKLIEAGYAVDVYEASTKRLGGKIESTMLGDEVVNAGAEFVDTGSPLLGLAESLRVKVIEAKDQQKAVYLLPDGTKMGEEDFLKALEPVAKKIRDDRAIIAKDPRGRRAQQIDKMSIKEYLTDLDARVQRENPLPFLKYWTQMVIPWRNKNAVPSSVLNTAGEIYTSEGGQDASNISALQFINEACPDSSRMLASDCNYRIEGGTAALIDALEKDLKSKGAHFHMGAKATGIRKDGGGFNVDFDTEQDGPQKFDQVVFALPMHAMADIKGLDAFGLSAEEQSLLREGQYTHTSKFTVKLKPEMAGKFSDTCHFSCDGYQAWSPSDDSITFLVGGETANKLKGGKLVLHHLEKFAHGHGMAVDQIFDIKQVVMRGPDKQNPCYASPAPGQLTRMVQLSDSFDKLAARGIGVVGTYIPCRKDGGMSIGFMECGLESAEHITEIMTGGHQARTRALAQATQQEYAMSADAGNYVSASAPTPPKSGPDRKSPARL